MKTRIAKRTARRMVVMERAAIRAVLIPIVIIADRRVTRSLKRSA